METEILTHQIADQPEQVPAPGTPAKPAFFGWSIFLQALEGPVGSTFANSFRDFHQANIKLATLLEQVSMAKFKIGIHYSDGVGCLFEVTMTKDEFDSGTTLDKVLLAQILHSAKRSIFSAERTEMAEILSRCNNEEPQIIFD
jgi:hypothetical protein